MDVYQERAVARVVGLLAVKKCVKLELGGSGGCRGDEEFDLFCDLRDR